MARYLLTGGTGFLGSLLSIELIKNGDSVVFLGRSKEGTDFQTRITGTLKRLNAGIIPEKIEAIEFDLRIAGGNCLAEVL